MKRLENRIKRIAKDNGAALVGIASLERLLNAPPSGDPRYLLPSVRSVISMVIPFDRKVLHKLLSKSDWGPYNFDKKANTQRLYLAGDRLVDVLRSEGFEALTVEINNNYRPEPGARDVTELVTMTPDFSLRYGAVAAGLGRLGWSGNVMTPEYGSAVLLGAVLTSATLAADPLLEENPCDRCKMCVAACPVDMMSAGEQVKVTVAGMEESIARKRTNNCCWIGCTGYHGLSANRKWSSWSPYRLDRPLPSIDKDVDDLCTVLRKADPDASLEDLNIYTHYRQSYFDPDSLFFSVCGHCANVCWPERKNRIDNGKRLAHSGMVVLRASGERSTVHDENEIVEVETPLGANVAMLRREYEAAVRGAIDIQTDRAYTLADKTVLRMLRAS